MIELFDTILHLVGRSTLVKHKRLLESIMHECGDKELKHPCHKHLVHASDTSG
jgi:hypothetical protein